MRAAAFLLAPALESLGLEHGFGTRHSAAEVVAELCTARQVHGSRLLHVPPPDPDAEADALTTTARGVAIGVRTADCVPLLLAAEQRGVAAVHAGWRGSAARIAECAVRELCSAADVAPDAITAVIGPHIGPCCYEVDSPVYQAFDEWDAFTSAREGHWHLDLGRVNRDQLKRAGVHRISSVGGCTSCDPDLFESYRRDGGRGRMLHYIRL